MKLVEAETLRRPLKIERHIHVYRKSWAGRKSRKTLVDLYARKERRSRPSRATTKEMEKQRSDSRRSHSSGRAKEELANRTDICARDKGERGGPPAWIYIPSRHFEPSAARLKCAALARADVIKTNYARGKLASPSLCLSLSLSLSLHPTLCHNSCLAQQTRTFIRLSLRSRARYSFTVIALAAVG